MSDIINISQLKRRITRVLKNGPSSRIEGDTFSGDASFDLDVFADMLGAGQIGTFNTLPEQYQPYLMEVLIRVLQSQNISQMQFNVFWRDLIAGEKD